MGLLDESFYVLTMKDIMRLKLSDLLKDTLRVQKLRLTFWNNF